VMRDPDDFFEHAGYLGGLHPSELEGEFTSIAFADVWLDFEKEHGDASEASTRYVPLAWLAVKLFEAASGSCDDSQESKSLCCQAVQLLDPDGNVDVCWPRGCVRQLETLRLPLFELATESEQQVLGTAAGSDVEEQAPEADGGGLRVHIIEYSRHPQSLRSALLSCESLLPCQRGLRDAGFSPELPSGAKIFVPAEFYEAVVMAVENVEDLRLTPGHVIVSEEFEEAALAAVASLRSREQVRRKRDFAVDCLPVCEQCGASKPRFECSRCHVARYCSRGCQTMHWQVHRKSCNSDEVGILSVVSNTFIHVDLPSSLRSGPSSCPKTASTSAANPRVLRNPRKA